MPLEDNILFGAPFEEDRYYKGTLITTDGVFEVVF